MNAPALSIGRDSLLPEALARPRSPDGRGIGVTLAVLVHLLLIAGLAFNVNWHAHEPEAVAAELWSAVPQTAAPRAVEPPPPAATPTPVPTPAPAPPPPPEVKPAAVAKVVEPPPAVDAQIAIEKARRLEVKREAAETEQQAARKREAEKREAQKEAALKLEAERQKAQREKQLADAAKREDAQREQARREQAARVADAAKHKAAAERERREEAALAAQREANLKRIQGQAGATGDAGSTGSAARASGPSASYAGRIKARIKPNIVFTDSISGNPVATAEVRCAADGTIVSRKLVKSSGNAAWDEAVLRAIDRTEVLPRDIDGRVPPVFQIDFKPRD